MCLCFASVHSARPARRISWRELLIAFPTQTFAFILFILSPRQAHSRTPTMSSLGKAAGSAAVRGIERCSAATFSPTRITSVMASNAAAQRSPFTSNSRDDGDDDNEVAPDDHHFGVWPPNQTTVIFQRMQVTCPDVIKAYSSCVVNKQNSGALIQGACDEQFRAVMDCFRSVR